MGENFLHPPKQKKTHVYKNNIKNVKWKTTLYTLPQVDLDLVAKLKSYQK